MKKVIYYLLISVLLGIFVYAQGVENTSRESASSTKAIKTAQPKMVLKPKITAALIVPLGPLRAGSRLFLKGVRFGTKKGKILIKGNFPFRRVELVNVTWANSKQINGFVPQKLAGQSAQTVGIVVVTSDNIKSNSYKVKFEGFDMDTP